ncbi:MAG: TlpA family protein disulfide reductase [Bacteroidetes bacterium]|nr:TlpA family protein disulfide reductase [Bacteroidota bacterium]
MKKFSSIFLLMSHVTILAQFNVQVKSLDSFAAKDAILYSLTGSKDVVVGKATPNNNQWNFKVPMAYYGMMKVYFPDTNATINLISENKNISLNFNSIDNKISLIQYLDDSNKLMDELQEIQQKKEIILPALYQIKEYYSPKKDFYLAIQKEINRLDTKLHYNIDQFPFVNYYQTNYQKYFVKDATQKPISQSDILQFILNSNEYLETSSLLRPLLVSYLNSGNKSNSEKEVQQLLDKLNVETPRGQIVLSELIDIFEAYGMSSLKDKFLTEAKNLKCTINDRLASTITKNKNTEIGSVFPDYVFQNTVNSNVNSIHQVKAKNKIVVFWSSTCSHCETELPKLLKIYSELKKLGVEIIGLSLDQDSKVYHSKAEAYPWVNSSELKGWNSSFVDVYNVHATPTYFILDEKNKIVNKPDHVQDVLSFFNIKNVL